MIRRVSVIILYVLTFLSSNYYFNESFLTVYVSALQVLMLMASIIILIVIGLVNFLKKDKRLKKEGLIYLIVFFLTMFFDGLIFGLTVESLAFNSILALILAKFLCTNQNSNFVQLNIWSYTAYSMLLFLVFISSLNLWYITILMVVVLQSILKQNNVKSPQKFIKYVTYEVVSLFIGIIIIAIVN